MALPADLLLIVACSVLYVMQPYNSALTLFTGHAAAVLLAAMALFALEARRRANFARFYWSAHAPPSRRSLTLWAAGLACGLAWLLLSMRSSVDLLRRCCVAPGCTIWRRRLRSALCCTARLSSPRHPTTYAWLCSE